VGSNTKTLLIRSRETSLIIFPRTITMHIQGCVRCCTVGCHGY